MRSLSVGVTVLFLVSCNRPKCNNTNPIFEQNQPTSQLYLTELLSGIEEAGVSNIAYWIDGYEEMDDKEYLVLNVQGENLCTQGYFEIRDTDKLEGIIKNKARGYIGAEIKGFSFMAEKGETINLVYLGLDQILD